MSHYLCKNTKWISSVVTISIVRIRALVMGLLPVWTDMLTTADICLNYYQIPDRRQNKPSHNRSRGKMHL